MLIQALNTVSQTARPTMLMIQPTNANLHAVVLIIEILQHLDVSSNVQTTQPDILELLMELIENVI
jgi:hypothetical protein